jgi:transcriptional regulator with XRE-family HTH domain
MLVPKIKALRNKAGLTQEQLGELAGISATTISKYETGAIYPTLDNLWKLSDALNCLVDDLYQTAE